MANNWRVEDWLERKVRRRDKSCVYCRLKFGPTKRSRRNQATWEHIDNDDLRPSNEENIALCCGSCNASKGTKKLLEWFESAYCKKKNINRNTVAPVVQRYVEKLEARRGSGPC
jgi:5-methylcytosine-specific restriction endonuclease McrA